MHVILKSKNNVYWDHCFLYSFKIAKKIAMVAILFFVGALPLKAEEAPKDPVSIVKQLGSLSEDNIKTDVFKYNLDYVWYCLYDVQDENLAMRNIAYEIDESALFIRLNDALIKLDRMKELEDSTKYFANYDKDIEMSVAVLKKSNCSEYDEACDLDMRLTIKMNESLQTLDAFGKDCGI